MASYPTPQAIVYGWAPKKLGVRVLWEEPPEPTFEFWPVQWRSPTEEALLKMVAGPPDPPLTFEQKTNGSDRAKRIRELCAEIERSGSSERYYANTAAIAEELRRQKHDEARRVLGKNPGTRNAAQDLLPRKAQPPSLPLVQCTSDPHAALLEWAISGHVL